MEDQKKDDFLVLSDVPAYVNREKKYRRPSNPDVDTVEIDIDSVQSEDSKTSRFAPEPVASYDRYSTLSYTRKGADFSRKKPFCKRPEGKLIEERNIGGEYIESVSVFDWGGDLGFYEKFRTDAERYRDVKGSPCPHVPFFSYVPQYSQMKQSQFAYYLYLRDELRTGRYPVADLSYILLLIYELINLGDCSNNKNDIMTLCGIWSAYRAVYPVIDKYLSEWFIDYCLIHSVDLPVSSSSFLSHVASRSSLKEFYFEEALKRSQGDFSVFSECLITSCSDYSPERSRYLTDDPSLLKNVKQIFTETVEKMFSRQTGLFSPDLRTESVIKRDAYSGSLCSYNVKKRLAVTVRSPFRSQDVRKEVTEILRYCENIVRKNAGIRSRLTAVVSSDIKELIDNGSCSRPAEEAYLALYDAPQDTVTIEGAIDLENSSWDSTERLVGDSTDDPCEEIPAGAVSYFPDSASAFEHVPATETVESNYSKYEDMLLKMIDDRDLSFEVLCRESGLFPDSAASDINESFSEEIGDIVLENEGGKYVLVEEYVDELKMLIERRKEQDATG